MSAATLAIRTTARRQLEWGLARARQHRPLWPAAGLVVATVVAYNFTLSSLFDYLRLDTPLAYLPLLPFFALWLALSTVNRYKEAAPPIADRQIDFIIGIPLVLVAIIMITLLPALSSTYYWTDRPDVLSLAVFVAAGVILLYGVNWLWRIRAAIVFLILAWPALYIRFMPALMQRFSDATNGALALVVKHFPLGVTQDPTSAGLLYLHPANQPPLTVSVGSACSGANSVLGFALIGGALLCTNAGGRSRKLVWLAVGLALTFAFNVFRLTSILALASAGHPSLALGAYHSVIGLVLFAIAVAVMMRMLPVFGLHPRPPVKAKGRVETDPRGPRRPTPRWRKIALGTTFGVVVSLVTLADHELQPYAAFLDGTGAPTVHQFADNTAPGAVLPAGVSVYQAAPEYSWAKQYFGANSTFIRYQVTSKSAGIVFADVVDTDDRGALDAYGLQNCFLFHNYDIRTSKRLNLGDGVVGLLLNYSDSSTHARWATVSWAWPVLKGTDTYYERIALTADLSPGQEADFRPDDNALHSFFIDLLNHTSGSTDDPSVSKLYEAADQKVQALAGELVKTSVAAANR